MIKNGNDQTEEKLLNQFTEKFSISQENQQQGIYHYFDTFDWRLYRQGYHLYLFNRKLHLYQFTNRKIEIIEDFHSLAADILDLQDGSILRKITEIIDVRALLGIAHIRVLRKSFKILNREHKTISWITIEQSKIKDKSRYIDIDLNFEIKPLRGYTNQVQSILKSLRPTGITVCRDDLLKLGLTRLNRTLFDYTSKSSIQLSRQMSALEATKQIYLNMLEIIRRNENGIIKDIDIEFLHDFRVAIRRTRSALGQIKGILDDDIVLRAKDYFTFLGRSTNKLRDIDVYLLREPQYKLMVPVELRQYLNPFFKTLEEQRKMEHRLLIKIIKSAKFKRILSEWESYLKSNEVVSHRKYGSVSDLARKVINKRNKKVLDFGRKILLTGSDDLLHELRIECKKLRYLLEFFQSLYKPEKIHYLIKKLKFLQDNLGDLNDLFIQQERLIYSAREIKPTSLREKNTILTLGILIGKLNEKQLIIKKEFAKLFSSYAAPDVQKLYDEFFQVYKRRVQ